MPNIISNRKFVAELSSTEKEMMYSLLQGHFLGTTPEEFEHDLAEKECAILYRLGERGTIVGFSTLVCFDLEMPEREVSVVFSGDTAVLKAYRSSFGFGEIARYFQIIRERYPARELYYLLTSKGWRTYRMLPLFFREFYPNYQNQTPSELKQVVDAFCAFKFPAYYDSERGLLTSPCERQRLRLETCDCTLPDRNDPHIQFFGECNPNYLQGDEIVCIASIAKNNLAGGLLRFTSKLSSAN